MIKRIVLCFLDLRAQVRLFSAEVRHDSAIRTVHEAREEMERSVGMAKATLAGLRIAQVDAKHAALHVRRHRERMAMGL